MAARIKFDGYRIHTRLDRGAVRLLTHTGLDGTPKYAAIAAAIRSLPARQAYLDSELCDVRAFSLIQNASDIGSSGALVFFLFDLLHLGGETIVAMPVTERKEHLRELLSDESSTLHFNDHQIGRWRAFYDRARVVVGWTDPEGSRPWLGAFLLAYYDPDGRLIYAGRRHRH